MSRGEIHRLSRRLAKILVMLVLASSPGSAQGKSLRVLFVEPDGRTPAANAPVRVAIDDRDYLDTTDGNGGISIEIPVIRYGIRVTLEDEGFLKAAVTWKRSEIDNLQGDQVIQLERGTPLGGRIETVSGEPIKGVRVILSVMPDRESEVKTARNAFEARTDNNGEWRCEELPERIEWVRLRLEHPYYVTNRYFDYGGQNRPIGRLKTFEDVIRLRESLTLQGRVLDEHGRGLKGANVIVEAATVSEKVRGSVEVSNSTGDFALKDLTRGPVRLTVEAVGYGSQIRDVSLEKGRPPERFLMQPNRILRGTVLDSRGSPIDGAEVFLIPGEIEILDQRDCIAVHWNTPSTRADSKGEFRLISADPDYSLAVLSGTGAALVSQSRIEASSDIVVDSSTLLEFQPNPEAFLRLGGKRERFENTGIRGWLVRSATSEAGDPSEPSPATAIEAP